MNDSPDNDQLLKDLLKRVEALEREAPKDQLTIGVMSGDLERVMLAFILAVGATTFDTEVEMVFTLRATAALRDAKKIKRDLKDLEPSPIKFDLKKINAMSLEDLISLAAETGVRITICNLSMDLLEIEREELIDYPNLTFAGVGSFVDLCNRSRQCWFM
ncbi:DsrE/DsrF/DrsH-like family protein [Rhodoferax sp.]|uniref:DsrE/DsrF/DrsH-like family protein n=1 Tax=Rhodoferax sp. TaxID=50421 RepID=UPI00283CA751|nr:DsrE/DsrF/DrsH-like family protein [Rhodoferax sp.]MDR3370432.1 DsrE/DsrF/DrsH-like family protein [Rhodoferax sp.]